MLEIFLKTLPFFLLIGTGWAAGRSGFFPPEATAWLLVGQVVGIHIDDAALTANGEIDVLRFKPLARMGYRDYTCVERVFQLNEFTGREAGGIAHLQESVHV